MEGGAGEVIGRLWTMGSLQTMPGSLGSGEVQAKVFVSAEFLQAAMTGRA